MALSSPSFRGVLGLVVPADELARLSAFTGAVGDGPYRGAAREV